MTRSLKNTFVANCLLRKIGNWGQTTEIEPANGGIRLFFFSDRW